MLLRFGGYWKSNRGNRFVHWSDVVINTANIIGHCNCYFNHYCGKWFIIKVEEEAVKRILFWLKRKERLQKRKCNKCCIFCEYYNECRNDGEYIEDSFL